MTWTRTGDVSRTGSPDMIRDAILRLVENREKIRSEEARQFIEKNFSMEQYRKVLEEIYTGLVDSDTK